MLVVAFFWQVNVVSAQAAPRLYFEPSSGAYSLEEEFDVVVKIDTNGEESVGADAIISFDQNRLDVNQVTEGDFFSGFSHDLDSDNGKLSIYVHSEDVLTTKSGVGDIATISFKTVDEGTAAVSFLCDSESNTGSSIWDQEGNDLIDCSATGSGSYEIGGEESTTDGDNGDEEVLTEEESTEEESTEEDETPTPTPSTLPETGVETPLLIVAFGGGILLLLGWVLAL